MKNKLTINLNLNNNTEEITTPKDGTITNSIELGVTKNIDLTSFEFKLKIFAYNQEMVLDTKYPQPGISLLRTDLDVLHYIDFTFIPGIKYKLDIEYRYLNNEKNIIFDFIGTKPDKPYPSWIWKDTTWIAPISPPSDAGDLLSGQMYEWNEQTKEWLPLGGYIIQ